ncbi:MAG: shikimate dehydrogenase [Pseudomonadota bacterium]
MTRYAVIGNPIAHSRSPEIHEHFADQCGVRLSYERLLAPIDGFASTVAEFFAGGGKGLNVTLPFKEEAARWVTAADALGRSIGAVNTIRPRPAPASDGAAAFEGTNTDGAGLVADLARLEWPLRGRNILMLGAGGAARGALWSLLEHGPRRICIANRTLARAQALCTALAARSARFGCTLVPRAYDAIDAHADVVINATSLGLGATADAFADLLPRLTLRRARCYDMMYSAGSEPTPFIEFAHLRGAGATADGLGMLVGQAAVAFEWWHGRTPCIATTLAALRHP